MSRTDIDPSTLACSLRSMAGDGSIEWVTQPIRARVLLDVADMLDENARLREQGERLFDKTLELGTENDRLRELVRDLYDHAEFSIHYFGDIYGICDRMRELGVEVDE